MVAVSFTRTNQRVRVSFGVTINTGNFTSVKFELHDEADIENIVSPTEARAEMLSELMAQARELGKSIKGVNPVIPK